MSLVRARIVKGAFPGATLTSNVAPVLARRIPREVVLAKDEAAKILADARAKADADVAHIREDAAKDARESEIARVTAELLQTRAAEEKRAAAEIHRAIDIGVLLAERLVGEALRLEPERIAVLAAEALAETRGARKIRIEACPDDVSALRAALATLGADIANVEPSADLARGSLVVHTELGRVDARLEPQLARLADVLRK